jgi:hypothetical protein
LGGYFPSFLREKRKKKEKKMSDLGKLEREGGREKPRMRHMKAPALRGEKVYPLVYQHHNA